MDKLSATGQIPSVWTSTLLMDRMAAARPIAERIRPNIEKRLTDKKLCHSQQCKQTGMERRRGLNVVPMESQFGLLSRKKRSIPSRVAAQ